MAKLRTHPFDPAEFLDTPTAIAAYLSDALASGSDAEFVGALNVVIRAHGLTLIAREAGVSRQDLCEALGHGVTPETEVTRRTLAALGLKRTPERSEGNRGSAPEGR